MGFRLVFSLFLVEKYQRKTVIPGYWLVIQADDILVYIVKGLYMYIWLYLSNIVIVSDIKW